MTEETEIIVARLCEKIEGLTKAINGRTAYVDKIIDQQGALLSVHDRKVAKIESIIYWIISPTVIGLLATIIWKVIAS